MTLAAHELIRRFLIHALPAGFHRIRHYGLFANGGRSHNIARVRQLLRVPAIQGEPDDRDTDKADTLAHPCPSRGGAMIIIDTLILSPSKGERGAAPRAPPTRPITSEAS